MASFLFVYGTLQPSEAPSAVAALIHTLQPMEKGSAPGWLYDLGAYPGAVFRSGASNVHGLVLKLPECPATCEGILAVLDRYEGVDALGDGGLFVRKLLPVKLESGESIQCWAYEYNGEQPLTAVIADGMYRGRKQVDPGNC